MMHLSDLLKQGRLPLNLTVGLREAAIQKAPSCPPVHHLHTHDLTPGAHKQAASSDVVLIAKGEWEQCHPSSTSCMAHF